MRRARTLAIACALGLTACTGNGDEPITRPTASSTATEPTNTAPTQPTPPDFPTLARRKTTAGAKAFVTYYINTINYSFAVPTAVGLVDVSPKGCVLCQSFLRVVRRMVRDGGTQTGGEWTMSKASLVALESRTSLIFIAHVTVSAGTSKRRPGSKPHEIAPQKLTLEVHTTWHGGSWVLKNAAPA